jgi:prepilin-type processing-associated H-X9-DG protein
MCNVVWCDGHVKAMPIPKLAETHMVGTLPTFYLFTNEDD